KGHAVRDAARAGRSRLAGPLVPDRSLASAGNSTPQRSGRHVSSTLRAGSIPAGGSREIAIAELAWTRPLSAGFSELASLCKDWHRWWTTQPSRGLRARGCP